MFARAFAPLTGAEGRERRLALAASLAFHAVVIGALIWLFVPSGDAPEATVTIEVTIVGSDGAEQPADTGATQTPPTAPGTARANKPPPPAAQESQPQTMPSAPVALPPAPSQSDAVTLPPPLTPAPQSAPASAAAPAASSAAPPSPSSSSGQSGGMSGTAAIGANAAASSGQQGTGEGDRPPRYRLGSGSTPYPPYPMIARRNGYQGRVVVRLAVAADGRATGAEVLESSGYDVLDRSAVDTLKDWKLEPALTGGKPVPGSVNVPVRFRLSG